MIKKILRWIGLILLTPVLIFLILFILLYIPPIQNFLREKATSYASEATGMHIGIERLSLSFPLNLVVKGVEVVSENDTLLTAGQLTVNIDLLPLVRKKVEVNGIDLKRVKVNSAGFIEGMKVNGSLGELFIASHGINLGSEEAVINTISLRDTDIKLCLNDTTESASDTASTAVNWKIMLHKLSLDNVSFALEMPADSLNLSAKISSALLNDGEVDLKEQFYRLKLIEIGDATINYNSGDGTPLSGFDPSHIALQHVNIAIDSLKYGGKEIGAVIRQFTLTERSGLEVTSLTGHLRSNETSILIPNLRLQTPYSYIDMSVMADWTTLANPDQGGLSANLVADIGKKDVLLFTGKLPDAFEKAYPFRPLVLRADVEGNLYELNLNELRAELPGAFRFSAKGRAEALLDSINRNAVVDLSAETGNLDFILPLLDASQTGQFAIPDGIKLKGKAEMKGAAYKTDFVLTEGQGRIALDAAYNGSNESYNAQLTIDSLQLQDFMPKDSLYALTASVKAKGQGTDIFSSRSHLSVDAQVDKFHYANYDISGIKLVASLEKSAFKAVLDSHNPLLDMQARLDALLNRKKVEAGLNIDVSRVNFYSLHMTDKPFDMAFNFKLEASSDMKIAHSLDGAITDLKLITPEKVYKTKDLLFKASTDRDSTLAYVSAGDLVFSLQAEGSLDPLIKKSTNFTDELMAQLEKKRVNQNELKELLPGVCLRVSAGHDNPVSNYLSASGLGFSEFSFDLDTSPLEGLSGDSYLYSLHTDSLQLDTIRMRIRQDTAAIKFTAGVTNGPDNKQIVFKATAQGEIGSNNAQILLKYFDDEGETGVELGVRAVLRRRGIYFHLFPEQPTIVFRPFELNKDNYIFVGNDKHVRANVSLLDKEGTGLRLYSLPDTTVLQDIAVEIRRIDLGEIRKVVPYMPEIGGLVTAEAHYVQTENSLQLASDVRIDGLTYLKDKIGDVSLGAVYLPGDADDHHLDAHLSLNNKEVLNAGGVYYTSGDGKLDANVTLEHFPLSIANAFVPDHMALLTGDMDGELTVKGNPVKPQVDGQLILDSVAVSLPLYGANFHFDNRPLRVEANRLVFDKFNIYTRGKNPFSINGDVNFSDFAAITADLRLNARNYELLNAPRTKESIVYGKAFVDFSSTVRGPLEALIVRGNVTLQGNTDITYVLRDSPLTTAQDRLGELVTFVDFSDTTQVNQEQIPTVSLGGIDMLMTIQIDQAAQVKADLTPDRSSYVQLEGGGDLSLQYTALSGLSLNGRYTLTTGKLKYTLIPFLAREFTIENGSYVNWSGNPMDPTLNLTAVNHVRASVTSGNQSPHTVDFEASISIKNSLKDLALSFNLSAPEDMTIQNELAAMSDEERSKQAVAMMVTGTYLGAGGGGVNMGNGALNSLLQSAIQGIAGSALKTVDITLGVETSDGDSGSRTDYSFRFAKRFWNNRISVIIGGKISTGEDAQQNNQSFIDNVSIEYRLDNSGTRYVKLFHDTNYDSILDGEIIETGVGLVLRKKMSRMSELFIFRKKKPVDDSGT